MNKTTSQNGINLIKKYEGCRLTAYKCPAGIWTIGYGHTGGVKRGMTITQSQADNYLKQDLKRFETSVNTLIKVELNQNQFDALVSFTYNCGPGNLQTLIKNRTLTQIADALLLYNKGGAKVLAGLTKRRNDERTLFLKGCTTVTTRYKVTATVLNVRAGAGTKYNVVKTLKQNTIIQLTTTSNGWGKLSDGSGWVSMSYLTKI